MGRRPFGNDVNPLSLLFTRPRLTPPTLGEVARRLDEIDWERGTLEDPELLAFFSPRTLRHICALRLGSSSGPRLPADRTRSTIGSGWSRSTA